jgi:hypothetical protein
MIDVNKITSTLAKLPDPQLQQYAQMHKNDPYIMALAMSESNRRKEMRAAGQGGQGMQEQPKVVDQMLAEMAPQRMPEDQGIGQLPAGEMNFAGGGIIAFADGGDVERYQSQGLVQPRARWEEELERLQAPPQESSALGRGIVGAFTYSSDFESLLQSAKAKQASGIPLTAPEARALQSSAAPAAPTAAQKRDIAARDRDSLSEQQAAAVVAAAQPATAPRAPAAPPSAPRADTRPAGPRPAPTAAAPAGSTPSGQFDVAAMMKKALGEAEQKVDPFEARQKAINTAKETQAKEYVTGLEAIQKQFSDIYKGKRDRLDTREGEIGKMKDQGLGLALLQAGASIMSTRGSIGQAIGAGIDTGSKQYISSLDKINSAKDKLSDARDRLDELEAQRGELSARELHEARNEVKTITTAGMEDLVKAAMAERKMNRTEAIAFVTAQLNANLEVYKQQQANVRTDKTVAGMTSRAGDPANKQLELQIKVQNLLQNNPLYKAAALRAGFKGPGGEAARSAMQNIERDTYAKFAPELLQLQSAPAPGAGNPPDIEALLKQYSGAQ